MKRLAAALALGVFLAAVAGAQPDDDPFSRDVAPAPGPDAEARVNELFGDGELEAMSEFELSQQALDNVDWGRFARARAMTDELLRRDSDSVAGNLLLGRILHRSDGNLPRALFHVSKARRLIEGDYGSVPLDEMMMMWHVRSMGDQAEISGAMGRHEDKIRHILEIEAIYDAQIPAQLGWPLMRLRRYEAARGKVEEALRMHDRPDQMAIARTALCAIEAEQQHREASWQACKDAADHERRESQGGPTPFTNAAEAALGVLRFADAEKLILEGTKRFQSGTVSNPWLDLTHLYLAEGRISEALDSVRRMFRWRRRQPAYVDEQNRAETELTSALFLIVSGRPKEAMRVTERILNRPDRTGYTSSETEQMEAGNALVDSVAKRMAAELASERASWSEFWDAVKAKAQARRLRVQSWSSGRRAAALLSAERILLATVRPYLAGSMEIPEWMEPEAVTFLGPGVVQAALERARTEETLPEAEGYFLAYETEVAWLRGKHRRALELAERTLQELPQSEQLLAARISAIAANAAQESGQLQRAREYFDQVMQLDPGIIRRLGLALPVSFEGTSSAIANDVVEYLRDSPRFEEEGSGWFRISVQGQEGSGSATLMGPQGTVYSSAEVRPRAGDKDDDGEDIARRLAREFHEKVFAPRIDLTQADLRSLDGAPTAGGGRASERLRSVLSDLVGVEEEEGE